MTRPTHLWLMALTTPIACGDVHAPPLGDGPDASSDGGLPDGDVATGPAAPVAPALPASTPCPPGWRAVPDPVHPEIVTCDPWGERGRQDCVGAEAHFPGGTGCERIGRPCPEGDWAEDLPDDPGVDIVYVKPGAAAGGTGSRARPASTISRALALAADGGVIALAKGQYEESVWLDRDGVTLWGACVAETILAPPPEEHPERPAVIEVPAANGVALRNFQIDAGRVGINAYLNQVPVRIDSVLIQDPMGLGLIADEGAVEARDLIVRGVGSAHLPLLVGFSIEIIAGGTLLLEHASLEGQSEAGIIIGGEGSSLTARDVAVVGATGQDQVTGLEAQQGGRAEVERFVLDGMIGAAVVLDGTDSALTATDLVVTGTLSNRSDGSFGQALVVRGDATATLSRAWLSRNRGSGIDVHEAGTLVADDLVIADTLPQERGRRVGFGLSATDATVTTHRVAVVRSTAGAIMLEAGEAHLFDATILDTAAADDDDEARGFGMQLSRGAAVDVHAARVAGCRKAAILVAESTLTADDIAVAEILPGPTGTAFGHALEVQRGGQATLERAALSSARGCAVLAFAGEISARDISIRGTQDEPCEAPCEERYGGIAVAVVEEGRVDLSSLLIEESSLCGLQLASGQADLHDGVIRGNPIGINVMVEGYDAQRLLDGMTLDNEIDIQSEAMVTPEPSDPVPPI